jgi:protein-S-isoprenylcysteine O-methyltransferase Ste14
MTPSILHAITLAILFLGWGLFALALLTRPRVPAPPTQARDRRSLLAIAVQGIGFGLAWGARRPTGTPFLPLGEFGPLFFVALVAILALGSAGLAVTAVRTLGKQWSLTARVLETHTLITTGPYAVVRHPIYTAMFGMLLATGLTLSAWPALLIAAALFIGGTLWRISMEERLLKQSFGEAFDQYAARVPAFVPWRW